MPATKAKLLGAVWKDADGRVWRCVDRTRPGFFRVVSLDRKTALEVSAHNLRQAIEDGTPVPTRRAKVKWQPKDYCPLELRSYAKVLADAKPTKRPTQQGDRWYWIGSGSDWWGVNPPAGIIPYELWLVIWQASGLSAATSPNYATAAEAMTALKLAVARSITRAAEAAK